jgi:hypothetical protein
MPDVTFRCFILQIFIPSDNSEQKSFFGQNVDFLVYLSSNLVPSLISFSFASDVILCVQSLDVSELKLDLRVRI